jgi:hypothetical protein
LRLTCVVKLRKGETYQNTAVILLYVTGSSFTGKNSSHFHLQEPLKQDKQIVRIFSLCFSAFKRFIGYNPDSGIITLGYGFIQVFSWNLIDFPKFEH